MNKYELELIELGFKNRYRSNVKSLYRDNKCYAHISVWENFMGTHLPEGCCIHHVNKIKDDNRIENLVCMDKNDHIRLHSKDRKYSYEKCMY